MKFGVLVLSIVVAIGAVSLFGNQARAVLMRESAQLEGGGGGYGGGSYTNTAQVPEITPGSGTTEINTTVQTANPSGLATYQYNIQTTGTLWYAWNRWASGCGATTGCLPSSDTSTQGWVSGLSNPNVTIGYDLGVVNPTTGANYPENSNIPVGTQIKLVFGPYVSNNIFWYGTGYSMDSPYGEWRTNATAPSRVSNRVTCDSKDYIVKYDLPGYGLTFDVYIPLVMNPPTRSISVVPSNLTCGTLTNNADGSASMLCTVNAAGPIVPRFHFNSTYGKFYYRYYDFRTNYVAGCYGNNIAMTDSFGNVSGPSYNTNSSIPAGYQLQVPALDIDYPLNAVAAGSPPATPTLTCTSNGTPGQSLSFTVTSTDPDADTLRYGFDWTNAGSVNEWAPATGYVSSGSTQNVSHAWGSAGTYTVKVLAEDVGGNRSGWASCPVTVATAPVTLSCNASPNPVAPNQAATFSANVSGGSGNFSYSWSESGSVFGSAATASKSFTTTGTKTVTLTVTDNGPAPTTSLSASPTTITNGNSTTLTWSSTDATSCTSGGFATGGATSGSATVSPSTTTTYTVSCTGSGGTTSGTQTVTVNPAATPTASLSASPTSVGSGGASTLTWSSANASSCTGSGFATGNATSGSVTVNPLSTTAYSISCTGAGGTANSSATVTVVPAATASLTASPTSVTSGGSSTLTWSSTNATSCTGTGFATGNATSGSVVVTPGATTAYSVTCTGTGGSGSASATVTVTAGGGGGGGGGGGCFSSDTLVTMADGTTKAIKDVRVGDMVLGADPATGALVINEVTATLVHNDKAYAMLRINGTLLVTPEHEVKIVRNGASLWTDAGSVKIGDALIAESGALVPVTSITDGPTLPTVYNLTTFPSHTYFAGGVVVHNVKANQN